MVITTFENTETGVKTYVAKIDRGYSVSLQDTDTGEFLGTVMIYPDEQAATKAAQKAAQG